MNITHCPIRGTLCGDTLLIAENAERDALLRCLSLFEEKAKGEKAIKDAQSALDEKVLARYATLTKDEIAQLLIAHWFENIQAAIAGEVQQSVETLSERIETLMERYEVPLSEVEATVERLADKVEAHLRRMGL